MDFRVWLKNIRDKGSIYKYMEIIDQGSIHMDMELALQQTTPAAA